MATKELTIEEANAKITELAEVANTAETKVKDLKDKMYEAKDEWNAAKDKLNAYRSMVLNGVIQSLNKQIAEKAEVKESPRIEEIKSGKKGKPST